MKCVKFAWQTVHDQIGGTMTKSVVHTPSHALFHYLILNYIISISLNGLACSHDVASISADHRAAA